LPECATLPPAGFLCWVQMGPPRPFANGVGYLTNIGHPPEWGNVPGPPLTACSPSLVELLPDFCDDPPRIPWGAWEWEAVRGDG